jgi:hypothetical protein
MSKENKVLLVANYLHDHPKATGAQIAKKFKCALSYAYVLMSKAKSIEMSVQEVVDEIEEDIKNSRLAQSRSVITNEMPLTEIAHNGQVQFVKELRDNINHPPHYKVGGIETIDFIEAKGLDYHLGNVIKYISRSDHKGDKLENLQKAQWYLSRAINNLK